MKWLIVLCFFIFPESTKIHDFHSSVADMNYNAKSGSMEVALRVFSDDLYTVISKNSSEKLRENLDDKASEKVIAKYLTRHFALVSKSKEVKKLNFIGSEIEDDATWLYIEFNDCQKLNDYSILNSMLVEEFADQTNVINVILPDKRKSLVFTKEVTVMSYPF